MNIAINGFGRIGRATFKSILAKNNPKLKIVAINDLSPTQNLAHLLKYDSVYGVYNKEVKAGKGFLKVGNEKFEVLSERNPADLPWKEKKVDLVLECTGIFRTKEKAKAHLDAGAKKVVISAPAKGDDPIPTIVMGVNENKIKKSDSIISMASCTTNCLAPLTSVIRQKFGIKKAIMTTVHAYTANQNIVDGPHKDPRRGRAGAVNIVPTTTGAAKATCKTIPELEGKFDGMAIRVPVPVCSLCDVVFLINKKTSEEEVNKELKKASKTKKLKGILEVSEEPLTSTDYIGNPASSTIDALSTKIIDGDLLKVISWYDNEWGYSNRLADICEYYLAKKLI